MIWWASESIFKPLMVYTVSFLPKSNIKCDTILYQIPGTLSVRAMNAVLQSEAFIAAWVCHKISQMHQETRKSFGQQIQTTYGPQHNISANINNYQFSYNISHFGHPLSIRNGILCCNESHSLLFDCFITFLGYITMILGASGSIYKPLMVHTVPFPPKLTSSFIQNIRFWAPRPQHMK